MRNRNIWVLWSKRIVFYFNMFILSIAELLFWAIISWCTILWRLITVSRISVHSSMNMNSFPFSYNIGNWSYLDMISNFRHQIQTSTTINLEDLEKILGYTKEWKVNGKIEFKMIALKYLLWVAAVICHPYDWIRI